MSFAAQFETEDFLLIFREGHDARAFIEKRVQALGIRNVHLTPLDAQTLGQADTVDLGLVQLGVDDREPLIIFNIDTVRPGFCMKDRMQECAGWLECFKGKGNHWSFVKEDPDHLGFAEEVVEKRRISDNCCTGMYYFSSASMFDRALTAERAAPSMPELYVAPLYQRLIACGHSVSFDVIDKEDLFFCGTPEEYVRAQRDSVTLVNRFSLPLLDCNRNE